jgi:UDP-N-acetylmuramoyl-L-alanyl-D-glutamate--2,6-diaminopimelate ligase
MNARAGMGEGARSLAQLFACAEAPAVSVSGLAADSRAVRPGDLFLACRGAEHDARVFIRDAEAAGAAAVVAEAGVPARQRPARIPLVELTGLRVQLGPIAARFHGEPSEALAVVGVTGTNGKTTVSQLLAQLLRRLDQPCGVIGTLGASLDLDHGPVAASHTTPDALALQQQLADWRDRGVRHAAMEVSSHALDQGRINGLRFRTAVFTNLSRDHLDYHGSMQAYGEAKLRLFRHPGLAQAVINSDDAFGARVHAALATGVEALTISTRVGSGADIVAAVRPEPGALRGTLHTPWGEGPFHTALIGPFNAANVAAACAAALGLGASLDRVLAAVAGLRPVPGRMEMLANERGLQVVIDYAHTPDALDKALAALRDHARGRVYVVFGCGGDRDRGKRAAMGAIACSLADTVFVTSDNPRGEDPAHILDDVAAGCSGDFRLIVDRGEAIQAALAAAAPGDAVLIAGKGHEDYQIIGHERLPFSDAAVARQALEPLS